MSKNTTQSTNWKERRRFHAFELKRQGWKQVDIATALDVSKGAVSQWVTMAKKEGIEGLASQPHLGRPPELSQEEKRMLPDYLWQGAEAYGFRGAVWTCARVRKVIEMEFGVSFHRSHVARLLKELNVAGMLRDHRLALSLADASFGEIRRQLQYKSDWFGSRVVRIDRFYPSSQLCSVCGVKNPGLRLEDREWTCQNCGMHHDRDINAARNIHAEALRLLNQTPVVATSGY